MKLKYFKITYRVKDDRTQYVHCHGYYCSPMEYLIISGRFPSQPLNNLLSCFSQLHYLSFDSVVSFRSDNMDEEVSFIELKCLTCVSLKFENIIAFYNLEEIIKTFFYYVETFYLSNTV